ncbi:MAG: YitT family protein [Clostridiales bacterium]|nr:YitT family protein [Roseburia sp.]MDD7636458.1 YitT family protein [Clostridiales bacterium]MDY4112801.1 YitT family protein [Roseburia sp.]
MNEFFKRMLETIAVVFGNCLYAFGVAMFIMPGGLITGGTTGIGLFVKHVTGLPVTIFVFVFNLIMFLIGFFVFGRKFAANTIVSTFSYPIALGIITELLQGCCLTQDMILCTVFGGICIGAAIGIVMRMGASTGGMDIPPLILNRYFKIPVSGSIYVFDMLILLLQASRSTGEQILYGILLVIVYSVVLDKCLILGTAKMQIKVVSEKIDEIRQAVLTDIDRGVTMLNSETGYMKRDTQMLLTVVSMRELARTEKLIHAVDEDAFVIINRVSEVSGHGFSSKKCYLEKES